MLLKLCPWAAQVGTIMKWVIVLYPPADISMKSVDFAISRARQTYDQIKKENPKHIESIAPDYIGKHGDTPSLSPDEREEFASFCRVVAKTGESLHLMLVQHLAGTARWNLTKEQFEQMKELTGGIRFLTNRMASVERGVAPSKAVTKTLLAAVDNIADLIKPLLGMGAYIANLVGCLSGMADIMPEGPLRSKLRETVSEHNRAEREAKAKREAEKAAQAQQATAQAAGNEVGAAAGGSPPGSSSPQPS